ncbi:MAG: hypothetical protein Q9163_005362 [Psora crenata]
MVKVCGTRGRFYVLLKFAATSGSKKLARSPCAGAFALQNLYSETVDVLEDKSDGEQADFDIDSDASNADLLELKQELYKLGPERTQRDLADTTVATQEITL